MRTDQHFFRQIEKGKFLCLLCPHGCLLSEGQSGLCRVRFADGSGIGGPDFPVTVIGSDPIEKKPFYHFLPGTQTLSLGFSGCNLRCPFCQNHELVDSRSSRRDLSPERITEIAVQKEVRSVSFTYSEPLVHAEFLIDLCPRLQQAGIKTLLVTNGCINTEAGTRLLENMDAVKVDLKSFDAQWYKQELGGDLKSVKDFIRLVHESKAHLEVVTLVVPGRNDSENEIDLAAAFLSDLDRGIPYHLSAYFPRHRYSVPPTEGATLLRLQKRASLFLDFVYTGNRGVPESTNCPNCGRELIQRGNFHIRPLLSGNDCPGCGRYIPGFFESC